MVLVAPVMFGGLPATGMRIHWFTASVEHYLFFGRSRFSASLAVRARRNKMVTVPGSHYRADCRLLVTELGARRQSPSAWRILGRVW